MIGSVTGITDLWMFALKRKFTVVASKVIAPAQVTDKTRSRFAEVKVSNCFQFRGAPFLTITQITNELMNFKCDCQAVLKFKELFAINFKNTISMDA